MTADRWIEEPFDTDLGRGFATAPGETCDPHPRSALDDALGAEQAWRLVTVGERKGFPIGQRGSGRGGASRPSV